MTYVNASTAILTNFIVVTLYLPSWLMSDKFSFSIAVQAKTLLVGRVCQMSNPIRQLLALCPAIWLFVFCTINEHKYDNNGTEVMAQWQRVLADLGWNV